MAGKKEGTTAGKTPAPKKGKAVAEPTSAERGAALYNTLTSRYPGRIFKASEYTMPWMLRRLPTGILAVDISMAGGFPAGGLSMIVGPENVGKNFVLNLVIANQQRIFGNDCRVAVISSEMPYDKLHARNNGVRVALSDEEIDSMVIGAAEEGVVLEQEYLNSLKDEVGLFLTVPPGPAEEIFDIAVDCVRSREFNVVAIDSFGAMMSKEDEGKDFDEGEGRGGRGQAKLNTTFMNKLTAAMGCDENGQPNLTCVLGINQVRDNQNRTTPYSPLTIEGGGRSLKHGRFVTLDLKYEGKVKTKMDGKDVPIGKKVGWTLAKQKAGGHDGHTGSYEYIWDLNNVNRGKESLNTAVDWGVVSKSGATYSYDGMQIAVGIDKAASVLNDTPELLAEIEHATLRAAKITCRYK